MSKTTPRLRTDRAVTLISNLSSVLVGLLALGSFSLSFGALRALAIEMKVVPPHLGWLFPLIVDGAIVVFSLCALSASLREEKSHWLRALVIMATLGSVAFNVAHVAEATLARILAATPPILLFLSFEALMHSIRSEMNKPSVSNPVSTPSPTRSKKGLRKRERIEAITELASKGLKAPEIALQLEGVSLRTIQRDLAQINGQ